MSVIIIQKFANREIRVGAQSIVIAPKNYGDKKNEIDRDRFSNCVQDYEVSSQNVVGGYALGYDRAGCAIAIPYSEDDHARAKNRLDIISEFQQRSLKVKNRGGWGFSPRVTAFGRNARHRLLEAGAIMDKLYGKQVCEVTCTVPGSTKEAFRTVSQWSGWIMNRLTQIVRRSTHAPGWFYVWELQKRGALHLHFAIGCSNLRDAVSLAQEIEFKWFEVLLELKDKSNVDVFRKNERWTWRDFPKEWRSHVLPVYKSVAAYFSKYVGKQSNTLTRNNKAFCPARWWGSSANIKREIDNERKSFSIEIRSKDEPKALSFCYKILSQFNPVKQYGYIFQLGQSAKGTELGGGSRTISFFSDSNFAEISQLIVGMADFITQTWGIYADIPELPTQTSKYKLIIGTQT